MSIQKIVVLIWPVLLLATLCKAQTTGNTLPATIIKQTTGDLDKDGIDETVTIYDIPAGNDNAGATRIMAIYKIADGRSPYWMTLI